MTHGSTMSPALEQWDSGMDKGSPELHFFIGMFLDAAAYFQYRLY